MLVCVCVRACTCSWPCHRCTADNPHLGQAQTALFQNTAEGNYKLGQPLDQKAGSILQHILSCRLSAAKIGYRTSEQWVRPPQCDKNTSRHLVLGPLGTAALGGWLNSEWTRGHFLHCIVSNGGEVFSLQTVIQAILNFRFLWTVLYETHWHEDGQSNY